jgi:hypothetical protein
VQLENKSSPYSVASNAVTVARKAVTVGRNRRIAVLGVLGQRLGQRPTFTRVQPREFQRTESACKLTHTQTLLRSEGGGVARIFGLSQGARGIVATRHVVTLVYHRLACTSANCCSLVLLLVFFF